MAAPHSQLKKNCLHNKQTKKSDVNIFSRGKIAHNTSNRAESQSKASINANNCPGFTLAEALITIAIVGILSAIALPNYQGQLLRTRQNETAALITQLQNAIVSYTDENGIYPESWKDLNEVAAIMTPSGTAIQDNFNKITLASSSCKDDDSINCYTVEAINTINNPLFTLITKPNNSSHANYNIVACLNLKSGSSDFRKGNRSAPAQTSDLTCGE